MLEKYTHKGHGKLLKELRDSVASLEKAVILSKEANVGGESVMKSQVLLTRARALLRANTK